MPSGPASANIPVRRSLPALPGWLIAALLIVAVAAPLWQLHIINRDMPSSKADLVPVWVGVRVALSGNDPYSDLATRQSQTLYYGRPLTPQDNVNRMGFAYPAHIAFVLAPIKYLSWRVTRLAFLVVVPGLLVLCVPAWFSLLALPARRSHVLLAQVLLFASWPVMWSLRLQQPTLLVVVFITFGCLLLKRGLDSAAGVLLSLATIKPQLTGLLLAWLVLWALLQRRWQFVVSFSIALAVLLAGAEAVTPGWISHWHKAGLELLQYTHQQPTLEVFFGFYLGRAFMIAIFAGVATLLWRLRHCGINSAQFGVAISLALAATLCLLPTDLPMVYNDVLLFPAVLFLLTDLQQDSYAAIARRISLGLLAWQFLSVPLAILGETLAGPSGFWDSIPFQTSLFPLAVLFALSFTMLKSEQAPARTVMAQPQPA